jgi:hypothetical protein
MMNKVKNGLNATVNDLSNSLNDSFFCLNTSFKAHYQNKLKILLNSSELSTISYKK